MLLSRDLEPNSLCSSSVIRVWALTTFLSVSNCNCSSFLWISACYRVSWSSASSFIFSNSISLARKWEFICALILSHSNYGSREGQRNVHSALPPVWHLLRSALQPLPKMRGLRCLGDTILRPNSLSYVSRVWCIQMHFLWETLTLIPTTISLPVPPTAPCMLMLKSILPYISVDLIYVF